MKSILTIAAAVASFSTMAQSFEGTINMTAINTAMDETSTIVWHLKQGDSRMDFHTVANGITTDYALIADKKGIDLVAQGTVTKVPAAPLASASFQLLETKGTVTINNRPCTHYLLTNGKDQIDLWASTEMGLSLSDLPFFMRMKFPSADLIKGFPVKMETRDALGNLTLSHEVTAVSATPISAHTFERK